MVNFYYGRPKKVLSHESILDAVEVSKNKARTTLLAENQDMILCC